MIFLKYRQADFLQSLVRASRCKDDVSQQQCLDRLPLGVRQLRSRKTKKQGPANSASKKRQKSICESLKRARQTVSWSGVTMKYEAEFVVRKNLEASRGHEAAENMWNNWCFSLAVKEVRGMREPVTQAEALALWKSKGYTWDECFQWWSSIPTSVRRVEEMSMTFLSYFERFDTLLYYWSASYISTF